MLPGEAVLHGVVLLQDRAFELERKLGAPACLVTANPTRTLYIYRTEDGNFLNFSVNTASSHVDYDRVDAIGMIRTQALPSACRKTVPTSNVLHPVQIDSHNGVRLGDSVDQILERYGQPDALQKDGVLVRMTYSQDQGANHLIKWKLGFEDNRLVEWSAEAFLVFYEVAG